MADTISSSTIDSWYARAKKNGAKGGKLLGAGGAGYLLFYYNPEKRNRLVNRLQEQGGEIMDFNFDFNGARVWFSRK